MWTGHTVAAVVVLNSFGAFPRMGIHLCVLPAAACCLHVAVADDAWLTEMATGLSRQTRRLGPADCISAVDAFSQWCTTRHHQQQQQQALSQGASEPEGPTAAAVHGLAAGLLTRMSAAAHQYSALQLCTCISSIAVQMGYRPFSTSAQAADAAALQGLKTLLQELSHAQVLADVPTRQVLALLQGLNRMQVQPEPGFTAAVQRDALQPRIKQLQPQQFALVARALAGLTLQMDRELLDGFWQEVSDDLTQLTGEARGSVS